MTREKKGITPVVAIVLLLLLTIAAAGTAFAFIQNIIQQKTGEAQAQAASTLQIKDMQCNNEGDIGSDGGANITVDGLNDGDVNLDNGEAYVYWVSNNSLLTQNTNTDSFSNRLQWDADTFNRRFFNISKNMTSGTLYRVEITFENGYTTSEECEP